MTGLGPVSIDAITVPGGAPPPGGGTRWQRVLDLATQWLGDHRGNSRTAYADAIGYPVNVTTGARRDVSSLRNGVAWLPWCLVHEVDPLEARRQHVVAWANDLTTTPHPGTGRLLGTSTRAHMVSAVSAFYRWLTEEEHVAFNPVQVNRKKLGVSVPEGSSTRSLTGDEVTALQHAADHDRIAGVRLRSSAIVSLLFGVGMSVAELVGLDQDDIRVIQGQHVLTLTLRGGKIRWVPLPPETLERLDRYLASRLDVGQGSNAGPVFITARGQRLHRTAVNELLIRLSRDAGLVNPDSISPRAVRRYVLSRSPVDIPFLPPLEET